MKMIQSLRPLALLSLCASLLLGAGVVQGASLDPAKPLVVTVRDSTGDLSLDEYAQLTKAVRDALAERGYTGEVEVKRWGGNVKEGDQSINLSIVQWAKSIPVEYECRLYGVARIDGEKYDLGVSVGRKSGLIASTHHWEETRLETATKSVGAILDKMAERELLKSADSDA